MKWTPALRQEYLRKVRWLLVFAIISCGLLLISVWMHSWVAIIMSLVPLIGSSYSWWLLREGILGRK